MKPSISALEAGSSYFLPCLILKDLKSFLTAQRLASDEERTNNAHTSLLLHLAGLESLVHQADTKSNVDTHSLFVDLASESILDKNVCRISAEFVSTVPNLGDDF